MKVLFLNNEGGGFADFVEVEPGTTARKFLADKLPDRSPADFMLRINRLPVAADEVLREGDRITATPLKIEGAAGSVTV